MKKLLTFSVIAIAVVLLTSCETSTMFQEPCETNQTGTVIVRNETNHGIYVDVTWGSMNENSERWCSNGYSLTYTNVPAGSIKIWGQVASTDVWEYDTEYLSACEDLEFTWYYNKSTTSIDAKEKK